jgi:protein-S-isoprenylcysteine O-methyltransferase Ste14
MFWTGVALAALGQGIRIWAAGTIHKAQEVTTGGPYAYVRHPLYCGTFFITLAYGLMSGLWWSLAVLIPLYLLLHVAAIASEERKLCELFGESYREYARQVGRFLPGWRQWARGAPGVPRTGVFCWRQVLANDEHVTVLFTVSMTVLFALRMVW